MTRSVLRFLLLTFAFALISFHVPMIGIAQEKISEAEPLLINTDLISINVSVTDSRGRAISGLDKSAFAILDNKASQNISFFSDTDAPLSVGILFDFSGSMSGDKINRAREALAHFIQTSSAEDDYFLIGFNSHAQLLVDKTHDADAILGKLTYVQPHGNTALLDAVYLGAERIKRGTHPKHALLLITDGGENNSRYSFKEVRSLLEESDVMLYSICVLDKIDLVGKAGMRVQNTLHDLSEATGGKAFYPQSAMQMDEIFERVALELRHQYSIGFKPVNFTTDGSWHRLKIIVAQPSHATRLIVHSKQGYFAIAR